MGEGRKFDVQGGSFDVFVSSLSKTSSFQITFKTIKQPFPTIIYGLCKNPRLSLFFKTSYIGVILPSKLGQGANFPQEGRREHIQSKGQDSSLGPSHCLTHFVPETGISTHTYGNGGGDHSLH